MTEIQNIYFFVLNLEFGAYPRLWRDLARGDDLEFGIWDLEFFLFGAWNLSIELLDTGLLNYCFYPLHLRFNHLSIVFRVMRGRTGVARPFLVKV